MIDQGYSSSNPQAPASLPEIKMAYRDEGPAPSHRFYGWVTG